MNLRTALEDDLSHTHGFDIQGINRRKLCFSNLLSGWELMAGTLAILC